MVGVTDIARMLGVSDNHIRRLEDRGALPQGIRLGSTIRWPLSQIEQWIADGCPSVRKMAGR